MGAERKFYTSRWRGVAKLRNSVRWPAFVPQAAAQIPDSLLWSIPWFHHVILIEKVKDLSTRRWYMEQTLANGWSRNVLALKIEGQAHTRQGKAISNFAGLLPAPQSDLAQQTLKDPYIFDFLCQEHDRLLAEYSFAGIDKPLGVSTYELTRALPSGLQSALPTVEEIEAELGETLKRLEQPPSSAKSKNRGCRKKKGGE